MKRIIVSSEDIDDIKSVIRHLDKGIEYEDWDEVREASNRLDLVVNKAHHPVSDQEGGETSDAWSGWDIPSASEMLDVFEENEVFSEQRDDNGFHFREETFNQLPAMEKVREFLIRELKPLPSPSTAQQPKAPAFEVPGMNMEALIAVLVKPPKEAWVTVYDDDVDGEVKVISTEKWAHVILSLLTSRQGASS